MTSSCLWFCVLTFNILALAFANHAHNGFNGWGWTPNFPLVPEDPFYKVTPQCKIAMKNATFNLNPLYLTSSGQLPYYSVTDERYVDSSDDDYRYAFNVCGAVLTVPDGCHLGDMPNRTFCDNNTFVAGDATQCEPGFRAFDAQPVYAYQMKLDAAGQVVECWHLSDATGGPGVWRLLNDDNPSEGVVVTYLDGDYSASCAHNRQIEIEFACDNDHVAFGIPGSAHSEVAYTLGEAGEPELCQYKLQFRTIFGCPSECPIVGNKLCNGVGLCGYDWSRQQPRCYCFSYFEGDSCTEFNLDKLFSPRHDPVTANASSPYVQSFTHSLAGPTRKHYNVTVTYDLSEFAAAPTSPYIMRDVDGYTHTYVWNFMNAIDLDVVVDNRTGRTLRDYGCGETLGYCVNLSVGSACSEAENRRAHDAVYVYQIDETTRECVVAGGASVDWRLYDVDNPARGVVLTFADGDYWGVAHSSGQALNRRFEITLLCPDDSNAYVKLSDESQRVFNAFVEEDNFETRGDAEHQAGDYYAYHVQITSAFACPDECVTDALNTPDVLDDVSVCSTQGMCAADPFSGYVHCLCDDGWTGDYCEQVYHAPSNLVYAMRSKGSYIAAIVIMSALIAGICWFGYKQIRRQKKKVKELEIKLVNYQSSGGGVVGNVGMAVGDEEDERPPSRVSPHAHSGGASLSAKIKKKFGKGNRGQYANLSNQDDEDEDEEDAQMFNVKVRMNGGANAEDEDDEEEENEENDEEETPYVHPHPKQYQIGDDEDEEEEHGDDHDKNEN